MTGIEPGDTVIYLVDGEVISLSPLSGELCVRDKRSGLGFQAPAGLFTLVKRGRPAFVVGGEVTAAMGEPPVGSVIRHYDGTYLHTAVGWVDAHGRNVTVEHQMDGYEGPIWGTFMVGGEVKETTLLWLGDGDA